MFREALEKTTRFNPFQAGAAGAVTLLVLAAMVRIYQIAEADDFLPFLAAVALIIGLIFLGYFVIWMFLTLEEFYNEWQS